LFIATPLLIVPLVWAAKSRFSVEDIGLFVAAFGATGHHLPGMMRAYGDRALFQRFKIRFIAAPVFLLTVSFFFASRDLEGLTVIVLLWGIWHAVMQVYGFLRIYDAKVKSFAPLTSRLDMLMCIGWFGVGVLYSPGRIGVILEKFYESGGPLIPAAGLVGFQWFWGSATALVTLAFFANVGLQWKKGVPPSPIKLVAMASSFAFWWFAMVSIHNVILGVAIWEIFHDVQYLAIVWIFNRKRAENDPGAGSFTRFLFRRSGLMVGLYVGLVFAYGYLTLLPELIEAQTLKNGLVALLVTSTLLHFYYDGFIWKVREQSTRKSLGIAGGKDEAKTSFGLPMWMSHGLRWTIFVIPVAFLGYAQYGGVADPEAIYANLVEIAPGYDQAQNNLGVALNEKGDTQGAMEHFESALQANPEYAEAHYNMGVALASLGQTDESERHYRKAIELQKKVLQKKTDYSGAHVNLGNALRSRGKIEEAAKHFREAVDMDPNNASAQYNLGVSLHQSGDLDGAVRAYGRAVELRPDWYPPMNGLAWILATHDDPGKRNARAAIEIAEQADRMTGSNNAQILHTLAAAHAASGAYGKATQVAEQAMRLAQAGNNRALLQDISRRLAGYQKKISREGQQGPP
jgi:Flp pilus assembly protein TadD